MQYLILTLIVIMLLGNLKAQNKEYNPFEELGYKPKIATLSQGEFNEFFNQDSVVQIGSVYYNRITNEIIGIFDY